MAKFRLFFGGQYTEVDINPRKKVEIWLKRTRKSKKPKSINSLLAIICLASPLFADEPILDELKGVILIPSQNEVEKNGDEAVEGFCAKGLAIPGGDTAIDKALGPNFIGKPLTQESLQELKLAVLRYYRDQGYPVVIVEIPEQNLKSGVVQLVVIESELDHLQVKGNRWFFDSFYNNKFSNGQNEPIHAPTLLNDIAWLNRNPFQNASAVFSPGSRLETTDVTVVVNDAFPLRFYVGGDNTGNQSTENTRLFAGCNWGYAFFLNQVLSYQYSTSPDFKSFWAHTINYTILLPWKNSLVLFGGLSGVKPSIEDFKGTGHSYQASLRYQIPFKPFYTNFSQELAFGLDFKRTNNNVNYVPEENLEVIGETVNLFQMLAQYSLAKVWGKNQLTFQVEAYGSPGQWLPDQKNADYSILSFGAKNAYAYGKGALSYLHYLPKDFSLLWFLRGQGSTANLLPSEEMGIGGYDTVRGYDERIINVSNALVFNFEIKSPSFSLLTHWKRLNDQLTLLAFFDYGGGNDTKSVPNQSNWLQIYSIGPGLRYRVQNYLSFRFDWGIQLKKAPFSGMHNKVHLGLMLSY